MLGNNNDDLDPISFWVLLLLSGGQKYSFHDLVKSTGESKESVWEAIKILKQKGFIKNGDSKFMIEFPGVEYLVQRGVIASEVEEDPKPKDFKNKLNPPHFSSWTELFTWLAFPLILLIPTIWIASYFTAGFNFISVERRIYQYGTWLVYLALIALYVRLSYHYVMESERLVVFRGGKAIAKKGPGPAFVLPLVDHVKIVDMRERTIEIKKEPCLTRDNMLANAGFYLTWKIDDPILSLTKVSKVEDSMSQLCAATLRTSIAQYTMEDALERPRTINELVKTRIEHKAGEWGVEIKSTELRELHPPEGMLKQLENRFNANLESEASLARSNAKVQSLRQFLTIGEGMARNPIAFNLKYLDTLEKIGEGTSTKYIIPMEFFNVLREFLQAQNHPANNGNPGNANNPAEQLPPAGPPQ